MNLVVRNLDCWNLWVFLKTCSALYHLLNKYTVETIVVLEQGGPHEELNTAGCHVLMELFKRIFSQQKFVIDSEYRVTREDVVLDEEIHAEFLLPNDRLCVDPVHQSGLAFVRKQLLAGFPPSPARKSEPDILYVSRSDRIFNQITRTHPHWTNRMIRNNQALKHRLRARYGGRVHQVDKVNLPTAGEQLAMVASADILFGIHGAGLNWIIGAQPGACLYEFFPQRKFQFNGINLCRNLGFGYHSSQVDSVANDFDLDQVFSGLDQAIALWKQRNGRS